jgi:septal ring factor EnvC (AmiA/AmiB activator)
MTNTNARRVLLILDARGWRGLLAAPLCVGLLAGPAAALEPQRVSSEPPSTKAADAAAAHEQNLNQIEARMRALQQALAGREHYREALYEELERYERDVGALAQAGRALDEMLAEQRAELAELRRRREATAEDLAEARAELADLLRSAYAMGRGDQLRLLLNQEDPTRVGRVFGYYRAIGRVRARKVRAVEGLSAELRILGQRAEAETERLRELAERQQQTRLRLEAARLARAAILDGLEAAIAGDREQVAALDADAESLRSLIEQLRRKAQIEAEVALTQEAIAARRGLLHWPVDDAEVLRAFGGGPAAGDLHADGVLIAAATGSEVHAVHHGRVIYADWLRGFGLLLVIDHGDGYMSLYGHNESLLTEVGEWVSTGEVIALSGASGGSGDRGLYFAIRRHGEPLDPSDWCRRERG